MNTPFVLCDFSIFLGQVLLMNETYDAEILVIWRTSLSVDISSLNHSVQEVIREVAGKLYDNSATPISWTYINIFSCFADIANLLTVKKCHRFQQERSQLININWHRLVTGREKRDASELGALVYACASHVPTTKKKPITHRALAIRGPLQL